MTLETMSVREPGKAPEAPVEDSARRWRGLILFERLRGWLSIVLGAGLLALSLWVLHKVLQSVSYHELMAELGAIGWHRIAGAILLTGLSFLALVGYELGALHFAGRRLSLRRTALGSFLAQSIAHTTGFAPAVATGIRYQIYAPRGIEVIDAAAIQGFFSLTFGLGLATLLGLALLLEPEIASGLTSLPPPLWRSLGVVCLALTLAYLAASFRKKRVFSFFGYRVQAPGPALAALQIGLAVVDLGAAAGALWMLMPPELGLNYVHLAGIYVAAILLGLVSHVPGALGVLEGAILLAIQPPPELAAPLLGSLLAFRAIYYLLPFLLGSATLGILEFARLRSRLAPEIGDLVRRLGPLAPTAASGLAVLAGAVLLLSGATPSLAHRLNALATVLPVPVIEFAHLAGSLVGTGLLLLARPLHRRLSGAWSVAVGLLVAGLLASLLKGFDFEEAILLLVVLGVLLPTRSAFYRRSRLRDERLSAGSWLAVAIVLGAAVWVLFYAYAHVDYDHSLWWQVGLEANAPRSMRATLAAGLFCLALGLRHLLLPAQPLRGLPGPEELARARAVVEASPAPESHLALAGDKALLFNDKGTAFVMYGVSGRSWIAMGEPVGPPDAWRRLVWDFHERADRHGGRTVFYEIRPTSLPFVLDLGLRLVKLGERALVSLESFDLKGKRRQDFRTAINRAQRSGSTFEVLEPEAVRASLGELEAISETWLATHKTREKRFSLGFFAPDYIASGPVAVVRKDGRALAFANLWLGAGREACSIDLMRYLPDAGPGIMDHLMVETMLWAKAQGYRRFDLGMAPLSGLPDHRLAPFWSKLGRFMVHHGAQFYNFSGLRAFKDKFDPEWQPAYLAYPEGTLPRVLADVAGLVAGGWGGIVRR